MEISLSYLLPEIIMLLTACAALILGMFRIDAVRRGAQVVSVLGLIAALIASFYTVIPAHYSQFLLVNPMYITVLTCVIGILSVLAAWDSPFRMDPEVADTGLRGEFFAMMLFSLAGVSLMPKVNDLVWMFIVLELVSIPTYVMVAMSRGQKIAQEAGVKYFFLGSLAAAIYLFGFSYLYGYAGTTRFFGTLSHPGIYNLLQADLAQHHMPMLALIGLLMVLGGLAYKIAAVPMHFYTADVYQGAATPVTAFLAYAPKAAGMVAIISILNLTGWQFVTNVHISASMFGRSINALLIVMAVMTMTLGNVLALLQRHSIKRMLAYSSIAHSGYMLVGIVAGPGVLGFFGEDGIRATLFYLGAYSVMNLGAFAALIFLQSKGDTGDDLDDLAGAAKAHPYAALLMTICLFSLIGLPPTVGFFGKLYIIEAALGSGHTILAVIVMINAAIAAAYYLRVVETLYLREAWTMLTARRSWAPKLAATICAVGVILLFIFPSPMASFAYRPSLASEFGGSAQLEPAPAEQLDPAAAVEVKGPVAQAALVR